MVAIPVAKLFSFVIKSATKPLAKRVVSGAQRSESVRDALSRLGQFTNATYYRVSVYLEGHTLKKNEPYTNAEAFTNSNLIKPLDEDKALKAGSDIFAEGIVYSIGGGLIIWEYIHSNREKEKKDAKLKGKEAQEKKDLLDALEGIKQRISRLESQLTQHQAQGVVATTNLTTSLAPMRQGGIAAPPLAGARGFRRGS